MDDAERRIALLGRHHDAERHDVGELLEPDILALHLAPDRIGGLLAPGHNRIDAAFLQRLLQLGRDPADETAALLL